MKGRWEGMETFLEILKVISPACITGVVTFLVTKYNYYKDIPLDKLEITYNRVYYPIYNMVKYKNVRTTQLIEDCEDVFKKYSKYVNRSTITAFEYLRKHPDKKRAYTNFEDNICNINSQLRRRLGYLESDIFDMYTYSNPRAKRKFRMGIEIVALCFISELMLIFPNEKFQNVCVSIATIILIVFCIELIMGIAEIAYTKMKR